MCGEGGGGNGRIVLKKKLYLLPVNLMMFVDSNYQIHKSCECHRVVEKLARCMSGQAGIITVNCAICVVGFVR